MIIFSQNNLTKLGAGGEKLKQDNVFFKKLPKELSLQYVI
jgi:hypothetical protein